MSKFFLLILIAFLIGCESNRQKSDDGVRLPGNQTELKTFPVAGGWGYSIEVNGSKFIRQESIPVLQGSRPFATKAQAEKIGSWVATRIHNNETFSLTLPQLQSLIGTTSAGN